MPGEQIKTPPPGGIGGGGATLKEEVSFKLRDFRCVTGNPLVPNWSGQSGKRDSNPRHQPWQGCALPTELFPHRQVQYNQRALPMQAKKLLSWLLSDALVWNIHSAKRKSQAPKPSDFARIRSLYEGVKIDPSATPNCSRRNFIFRAASVSSLTGTSNSRNVPSPSTVSR